VTSNFAQRDVLLNRSADLGRPADRPQQSRRGFT
jgi:hypothetical protein